MLSFKIELFFLPDEDFLHGYIRVSTSDQNEDRQFIALREMSIPEQNIFMDKQSSKDFNRSTRSLSKSSSQSICSTSRALTGWDAIMKKAKISDGFLPRRRASTLWYWIYPCWTPGEAKT